MTYVATIASRDARIPLVAAAAGLIFAALYLYARKPFTLSDLRVERREGVLPRTH